MQIQIEKGLNPVQLNTSTSYWNIRIWLHLHKKERARKLTDIFIMERHVNHYHMKTHHCSDVRSSSKELVGTEIHLPPFCSQELSMDW